MLRKHSWSRTISVAAGAAATILFMASTGFATTSVQLNLDQLTTMADDVVLGRVLYSIPYRDKVTKAVATETHIAVDRYLKSSAAVGFGSPYVKLRQPGGNLAPYGFKVFGTATFRSNEWVVVFLKRDKEGNYRLVGWNQGKFDVTRDIRGGATVQGSATALPSKIGGAETESTVSESALDEGGVTLESFERRVRGLAAFHRTFPQTGLDRGKAKGSK